MNTNYLYNIELEDGSLQVHYYEQMRDRLNSIIYRLNKSLEYLENINNSYKNGYSVDDYNLDDFNEVRNEISNRINYLKYTIIPAVEQKLDSLV